MANHIILHLGIHKTATTSLQDFLTAQTGKLLQRGARYVPLQRMRTDVTPLLWAVDRGRRARLVSFIDEVSQETVVFSDENIIGVPGELTTGDLYPYARNRIESFCEEMAGRRVTLFLTLREPHLFLISMYSEFLRHNEFVTFDQFLENFDIPAFSYRKAFRWLLGLPAHVTVRVIPFEKDAGGGVLHIAGEIVNAACGGDASHIDINSFPAQKSRSAYSTEELGLAAEIARRADPRTTQFFLNLLDHRDKRFGQTRFTPIDPATVELLKTRYRADLGFLGNS